MLNNYYTGDNTHESGVNVGYNRFNLSFKGRYKVVSPNELEKYLNSFLANNFDRGMRLRMIPSPESGTFELGARCATAFRIGEKALKNSMFYRETLPWKRNKMINSWKEKLYK